MYPIDLKGRNGVILGVANDRSIAWSIARVLGQAGARLALTYQGERLQERVTRLADTLEEAIVLPCDATDDDQIEALFQTVKQEFGDISFLVHSIAYANKEDLAGNFSETGREGFRIALEISAYSLLPLVKHAAPLMADGGSVLHIDVIIDNYYYARQWIKHRGWPGYFQRLSRRIFLNAYVDDAL